MSKSKELRAKARESLGHKIFGDVWLYALLALLVVSLIEAALGFTIAGTLIVLGPLTYAMTRGFIRVARKETTKVDIGNVIVDGFKNDAGRNIIAGLLVSIYEALWTMLFVIPGLVKSYSYAMTFFIMNDDINISANDAITKSRNMMNGHKWELFCLDLSFIGWYILGSLCFGIGLLWVEPYHQMARIHFFDEVKAESEGVIEAK